MAFDWAAMGVVITVIVILCGVFYRLGTIQASKADKNICIERAEMCNGRFLSADQSVAKLHTAVARVEEQQKAGAENLRSQIRITERLEGIVADITKML